jgi:hypothetical protein
MNACDDGSPSTFADTCDGAGTCAGRVVVCPQETACSLWLPNGTDTCTPLFTLDPCDDGLLETSGDACDGAGTCVGNPVVCPAALPCTRYAPDGTPTCRPVFLTTACDDGAVATSDDACDGAGACVGRPVTCPSDTACTLWTPNGTATCTPAFTTAACDDADAATFGDTCDGRGACAGTPVMCPESTACTRWATNGTATCTRVFTTDACDDGRLTTHTDTCDGQGNCAGTPVNCPAATACTRYEADGTPTCQAVFTTGACDDGNACTQVDRCDAGRCVGSSPVACRAPDRCETAVRCVPETGACVTSLETAGTACDDGLAANVRGRLRRGWALRRNARDVPRGRCLHRLRAERDGDLRGDAARRGRVRRRGSVHAAGNLPGRGVRAGGARLMRARVVQRRTMRVSHGLDRGCVRRGRQ